MNERMHQFGAKNKFFVEFKLARDPDNGRASSPLYSSSWGHLRIILKHRNIFRYSYGDDEHHHVTWYLLPIFEWLAKDWIAIFNEERFPTPERYQDARTAYLSAMGRYIRANGDEHIDDEFKWRKWMQRHSLRGNADGGIFPDLFIRRYYNEIEFSWGDRDQPGTPENLFFLCPRATVRLDIEDVAAPLYQAIKTFRGELSSDALKSDNLYQGIEKIPQQPLDDRMRWFIYGDTTNRDLNVIQQAFQKLTPDDREILSHDITNDNHSLYFRAAPMVAMFGALAPDFAEEDVIIFLAERARAKKAGGETDGLKNLVRNEPIYHTGNAFEQGYSLALDVLDDLYNGETIEFIDIRVVLENLCVAVREVALTDASTRGAAMAGHGSKPTILINKNHPMNGSESGQRFTLAHELCHLLFDRDHGSDIIHPSGRWAPPAVEKRANAFAAMFLMPEHLLNKNIDFSNGAISAVQSVANKLRVGVIAAAEHLANLDMISEAERDIVLADHHEQRRRQAGI